MFRCLIKDIKGLNGPIKSDIQGIKYDIGKDLLTSQNGTISLVFNDDTISEGDIAIIINSKGKTLYKGKIKSKTDEGKLKTESINEILADEWVYDIVDGESLEQAIANSLKDYIDGKLKNSTWVDPLRALELGNFEIEVGTQTEGSYEEQKENYVVKMSKFIYELYDKYGIVVDIDIPIERWTENKKGKIKIFKPNYSEITISDNVSAIQNLSITTSVESTNRLVIYNKDGSYRKTFVYTSEGIKEEPEGTNTRLKTIKTKVVFSDDEDETLIQANLPDAMFNHKITFDLLIDNKIYNFDDFKLGAPVKLFYQGHYYYSVLTAYRIVQNANEDVIYANFTLGKVRTSLTKKLKYVYGIE